MPPGCPHQARKDLVGDSMLEHPCIKAGERLAAAPPLFGQGHAAPLLCIEPHVPPIAHAFVKTKDERFGVKTVNDNDSILALTAPSWAYNP